MVKETCENSFDDIPIITRNKQFSSLLEENLSKFQNDSRDCTELSKQQQTKPKFPYLRKGKCLQRYYNNPNQLVKVLYAPTTTRKKHSSQRISDAGLPRQQNLKLKPLAQKHEAYDKTRGSKNNALLDVPVTGSLGKKSLDCEGNPELKPVIPEHDYTWQNVLGKKTSQILLPEKTTQPELSYEDMSDGNHTLQENQELLAFELLEQHAANSSFSSSSSFVAALMERTVKSTPKKSILPEFGNYMNPASVNTDVHKQYTQNYKKYISSYPKSEIIPIVVHEETTNNEFNVGCGQVSKMVYNVAAEERSLHVHFEDENEGSEVSECDEKHTEKLDFKDESTWSNCSCCSSCSEESQVHPRQQGTVCSDNIFQGRDNSSTFDYSKYPSISVKTLKGILSPSKKSCNVSKIVTSTTVDKSSQNKVTTKNSCANVMTQTDDTEMIFKSELLTSRLQDLENEMEIFQKANLELAKMIKDHEDNARKFTKEKKAEEKKLKEEEERIKCMLEEERRKLGKERLVLQKHSKSLKNHPSKEEREEIQALKQQIAELQNEMHKKESRWTAFQVRSRDRTKCLEQENAKLKQEINELKTQKQKQLKLHESGRSRVENPTKIMNFINKQLGMLTTMNINKAVNNGSTKQILKYQNKKPAHIELSDGEKLTSSKETVHEEKPSNGGFTETAFPNGDIEQKFENGRVKFYYASTKVFQTTEVNGTDVYEFPNGQTEYHYTDGSKKVAFVDGSIKLIYTTGQEEWVLPDNTRWTVGSHGEKVVTLPNGDKEISTEDYMRREYSDGTVRMLFPDGRIETRYPNGRLRVKNAEGQLILDLVETI